MVDPTERLGEEPEYHDAVIKGLTYYCSCGFDARSGAEMWKHQMAARGVVIADQARIIAALTRRLEAAEEALAATTETLTNIASGREEHNCGSGGCPVCMARGTAWNPALLDDYYARLATPKEPTDA